MARSTFSGSSDIVITQVWHHLVEGVEEDQPSGSLQVNGLGWDQDTGEHLKTGRDGALGRVLSAATAGRGCCWPAWLLIHPN